jgi:hypothetical protein
MDDGQRGTGKGRRKEWRGLCAAGLSALCSRTTIVCILYCVTRHLLAASLMRIQQFPFLVQAIHYMVVDATTLQCQSVSVDARYWCK